MNNIGGISKYIGFLDECGDHSLTKIDNDFPLFVLAMVIIERKVYVEKLIPAITELKLRYWNHEGINLHSRDIRKALGPFSFLMIREKRTPFLNEVSSILRDHAFSLFITGIHKGKHLDLYKDKAKNPYDLALEFTLERVAHFLGTNGEKDLPIVAEARGKKEDESLERVFYRIMATGTFYNSADIFKNLNCPLVFRSKRDNIAGIQIADLCAHPCARHILSPSTKNQAYDIVMKHLYNKDSVSGWKVFP